MKMTLLEMVQNILSAMDSDEVNSIADTVEALQVAEVVRETYFELIAGRVFPTNESLLQLESVSDVTKPNYLKLPTNVKDTAWIKYDYRTDDVTDYVEIQYRCPEDFFNSLTHNRSQDSVTEVTDYSGVKFWVYNDRNPQYYTSFDNKYLIFDAYNLSLESTLQQGKTACWGTLIPEFEMTDNFVVNLEADRFPLFLSESKAACFINFKQISNSKEEQRARRQQSRMQGDLWRNRKLKPSSKGPNYSRGRR